MPLTRYQTRSEYGLADPDLYRAADKDDPEALLEGVAMAGLVGILRQLGDLAEFAAEMFHDLHEEVMATAARSHGLMARVQQLEADFPSIEKALLCQTDHTPYFPKTGVQWHPTLQLDQNVVTRGDLPRCVMDSYEECRGPPRLFLLDKFDIAGAGACLKRYTDPSFVRLETLSYEASWDDIQREKKSQKGKRRGSHWRNGGTTENALSSHAKLHELFLEEHLEARHSDPARIVKLKSRKLDGYSPFSKSGESYMEKFVQSCVDNKTYEIITPSPELLTWNIDSARDVVSEIPEISMMGAQERSDEGTGAEFSFPNDQENASNINLHLGLIEKDIETVPESSNGEVLATTVTLDSQTNLNGKSGALQYRSYSEDLTSEADNYVDAPATMESETETDDEGRTKNSSGALRDMQYHVNSEVDEKRIEDPPQFSDFHSIGYMPASENGQSSFGKRSVSFSSSDEANISMDDQSDREKSSGYLPSTVSFKSEVVDSLSHISPSENKEYSDLHFPKSTSSSNADGHASFSSHSTSSSPRSVSQNVESCTSTVQSLAPEVVKTSPESGIDRIEGSNDESRVDPIDASVSGASFDVKNLSFSSPASLSSSASEESRYDTTIEKTDIVDYSSNIVYSGTNPQMFVDSLTGKPLPVADNAIQTNSADACSENLANLDSDPKSCDGSQTGKVLPYSVAREMEVSPDMAAKGTGPITVDEIHSKDTLDDDTDHIKVTDAVADVDSQRLAAEISNEHSCALDNGAAAVSVSESHEDTPKNEISMTSDVESSKLSSAVNSGVEKLEEDASSTSSKYDEQIRHMPAKFSSSYLDDEGCHDHPQLDDATTEMLPRVEHAVSENHAGTYCGDASHAVTLSSAVNTNQSSSEAEEICQEKFVESDGTIQADNNPESEEKMKKNPVDDMSSESLDVALDNNDLTSCESLIPLSSLDQRERNTETKSPCKSVDYCIDSSPVDNLNLSESTLEQSNKEQIPWTSHALVDEELLEPSVCQTSEFVPQSEAMDSPKQALNLEPAFPSFGLISETTPIDQEEIPPLPPLPPMQWRLGKFPHSNGSTFMGESVETSSSPFSVEPASDFSLNTEIKDITSGLPVSLGSDKSDELPEELVNNGSEQPLQSSSQFPTTSTGLDSHDDSFVSESAFLSATPPTVPNQSCVEDISSEESNHLADHVPQSRELDLSQESSLQLPHAPSVKSEYMKDETCSHVPEKSIGDHQSTKVEDTGHTNIPRVLNGETGEPSNSSVQMIIPLSVGDAMWPVSAFTVAPTLDGKQPEEVPTVKLPRPRSPLVDAVAAHDRRTMKKVSERFRPPVKQTEDDKDSLLAQIRSKSVNLKPAVVTRPNIQTGPKTNLRVAAILEKANTIRQAMVGSDEDDDSDGWSDS